MYFPRPMRISLESTHLLLRQLENAFNFELVPIPPLFTRTHVATNTCLVRCNGTAFPAERRTVSSVDSTFDYVSTMVRFVTVISVRPPKFPLKLPCRTTKTSAVHLLAFANRRLRFVDPLYTRIVRSKAPDRKSLRSRKWKRKRNWKRKGSRAKR